MENISFLSLKTQRQVYNCSIIHVYAVILKINYCGFIYSRVYQSEEIEKRTVDAIAIWTRTKEQAMIYKTLLTELKTEQQKPRNEFKCLCWLTCPAPLVLSLLLLFYRISAHMEIVCNLLILIVAKHWPILKYLIINYLISKLHLFHRRV